MFLAAKTCGDDNYNRNYICFVYNPIIIVDGKTKYLVYFKYRLNTYFITLFISKLFKQLLYVFYSTRTYMDMGTGANSGVT